MEMLNLEKNYRVIPTRDVELLLVEVRTVRRL